MVLVVMGVAGCGKSTVGRLLADRLGLPFHDADDYHAEPQLARMRRGQPLSDEDRRPWLEALSQAIVKWNEGAGAVLACSALKEDYRRTLASGGLESVTFIHLQGPTELLRARLERRGEHYFPPALLDSQLEALEAPGDAVTVGIDASPEEICQEIMGKLAARGLDLP